MEACPSRVGVFTIAKRGNKFWIAGLGTAWRSRTGSCGLRGWGISSSCWWAAPDTLACRLGSWGFSLSVQYLLQGEIGSAAYIVASQLEKCNYGLLESTTADSFFLFLPPVRKKWLIAIIYWCHIWLSPSCSSDPSPHTLTHHPCKSPFVFLHCKLLVFARHCGRWRIWKDEWDIIPAFQAFTIYIKEKCINQ